MCCVGVSAGHGSAGVREDYSAARKKNTGILPREKTLVRACFEAP